MDTAMILSLGCRYTAFVFIGAALVLALLTWISSRFGRDGIVFLSFIVFLLLAAAVFLLVRGFSIS